ncbi:MAG: hypothetical protein KGZ43_04245, partial [Sulfuritalea sp.]|nr:hypothetical protein [Sulfuritalea sp.]
LVENGRNGLLAAPGNVPAFLAASAKLARDLEAADWRAACAASVGHLGWDKIHDRYAELLHGIAARPPDGAGAILPAPTFGL